MFGRTFHSSPPNTPTSIWCVDNCGMPVSMLNCLAPPPKARICAGERPSCWKRSVRAISFDGIDLREHRLARSVEHGLIVGIEFRRQAAGKREGAIDILARDAIFSLRA